MAAEFLSINPDNPEERKIFHVVDCLRNGGVVIYPTDTVYGIGCDIHNAALAASSSRPAVSVRFAMVFPRCSKGFAASFPATCQTPCNGAAGTVSRNATQKHNRISHIYFRCKH